MRSCPNFGPGSKKRERPYDPFFHYLVQQCPALGDARKVTNGSKHFDLRNPKDQIHTGARGGFSPEFSDDFQRPHLWIDRNGKEQRAEAFIKELVAFWNGFFSQYNL